MLCIFFFADPRDHITGCTPQKVVGFTDVRYMFIAIFSGRQGTNPHRLMRT